MKGLFIVMVLSILMTACSQEIPQIITEEGQVTSISTPKCCYGWAITIDNDKEFIIEGNVQDLSKLRYKWVTYTYSTERVCLFSKKILTIDEYKNQRNTQ